jgi:cell division protein ZapA
MSSHNTTATEVEIFGALYHVRGDKDPEYLRELADEVDQKMREIAQQVSTVDTGKIAILAALNLTDELFQCRKHQDGDRVEIEERLQRLAGRLGEALQG